MEQSKQEILKELEEKFEKSKKEFGFEVDFKEVDKFFTIKDAILKDGYVSENILRQICYRIVDVYMSWLGYLHGLIMPNPSNMLSMTESKIFDEAERKEISQLMSKSMGVVSTDSLIRLTKDKTQEGKFIQDSLKFWKETFVPKALEVMTKINTKWLGK